MSRRVALQSNARDICAFIYIVTTHWHNTPEVTCARFKTANAVFVAGSSGAVIHLKTQKRSGKRKRKRKRKRKTSQAKRLIKRFSRFAGHLTAVIGQLWLRCNRNQ